MGYPGYPQQQQYPGYPAPGQSQSGPTLSVITGIIGLGVAGVMLAETFMTMSDFGDIPGLPSGWTIMWVVHFVAAAFALLGAVLVFCRQIAGAFLLMGAAVLTVAAILLDPLMAESLFISMVGDLPDFDMSGEYPNYFKAMFEFGNEQAVFRVVLAVLGLILLITAVLPPSLNWLKGRRQQAYGGYPQQW